MIRLPLTVAMAFAVACAPPASAEPAPPDISKWDLICYCNATVATPHFAVRADTNGRILFRAQNGVTLRTLRREGLIHAESQIYLLRDFHLLAQNGETWTTSMPLLGPDRMETMREVLREEAARLVSSTAPDARSLAAAVENRGFPDHVYSVLFSYALDGRTWDILDAGNAMPPLDITADHPFWSGLFWAVFPKRSKVPGTNSASRGKVEIKFTWTERTRSGLQRIQSSPGLGPFLESIGRGAPAAEPLTDKDGGRWRLVAADGTMLVPVIREQPGDPVFDAASRIAAAFAKRIQDPELLARLQDIIGTTRRSDTLLIAMHEFIWEALDAYQAAGIVRAPKSSSTKRAPSESDLRKFMLIVVHP